MKFTEEHKMFKKTVQDFVTKEIRPHVLEWEHEGCTPREVWRKCGEMGFLGIIYPEALGGQGLDLSYSTIFLSELAKCGSCGVALGISVQTDMATPAIAKHGNMFLKKNFLMPAIKGEQICSIAVSEPDHGSDVAGIETKAVKVGDKWRITGRKTFITNGTQSDWLCCLVRTNDRPGYGGLSLFVIPADAPGYSRGKTLKKVLYPSSDTAEIILDNVELSNDYLIGDEGKGFYYQMEQFQLERLAACAMAWGAMKHVWELTKRYISERQAFGRPLYKMQTISHKMVQMLSEIKLIENSLFSCVARANGGVDITKDVSLLKLSAAQMQQKVMDECVQIHGGWGLMEEYEVARYFRDSKLTAIGGGTNEIMKEIVAKMEGWE